MSQANDKQKKNMGKTSSRTLIADLHLISWESRQPPPPDPTLPYGKNKVFTVTMSPESLQLQTNKQIIDCSMSQEVDLYSWGTEWTCWEFPMPTSPTPPKRLRLAAIASPHGGSPNPFRLSPLSHGEAPIIGKVWEKTAQNTPVTKGSSPLSRGRDKLF